MPTIIDWTFSSNAYIARSYAEHAEVTGDLTTGDNADSTVTTSERWWSETVDAGEPITITYSFLSELQDDQLDNLTQNQIDAFTPTDTDYQTMVREVLDYVESITNITFIEVDEDSAAFDMHQAGGDIRIGGLTDLAGFAWNPATSTTDDPITGDVFSAVDLSRTGEDANQAANEIREIFIHELGHALGLEHLGADESENREYAIELTANEYTRQFSVEGFGQPTYADYISDDLLSGTGGALYYASTYQLFDIATLQNSYGANISTSAGNTTYTFDDTAATRITIYDANGTDTFDLTNLTSGVNVTLQEGQYSTIGTYEVIYHDLTNVPAIDAVSIAWGTIIERAFGSSYDDTIWGNDHNNTIKGNSGDDSLLGLAGDDFMNGGAGSDYINGGVGNDTIWAGPGDDSADIFVGGTGADIIGAGNGNDLIVGDTDDGTTSSYGSDELMGGAGNDIILTGGWDDSVGSIAGTFEDGEQVTSSTETNVAWLGTGNDTVYGTDGNETFGGGEGNDVFYGQGGNDTIYGGHGDGNDTIYGNQGNDVIFGGQGDDYINGGNAHDDLYNGAGSDVVLGGHGNDTLWGGPGDDTLTGGPGADTFAFGTAASNDTITDFDLDDDILNLANTGLANINDAASTTTINGVSGLLITISDDASIFLQGLTNSDLESMTIDL